MSEEKPVETNDDSKAVEAPVPKEEAAPVKEDKPRETKDSVDIKAEINRAIEDLWAEEAKAQAKNDSKGPSQEDFKRALSEVADSIEKNVRSEYESKMDSRLKELNEKIDAMSAVRQAPKSQSKNPFKSGEGTEAEKHALKKSYLERMGIPIRDE